MSSKTRKVWQISAILVGQVLALTTMIYGASLGVENHPDAGMGSATPAAHVEGIPCDAAETSDNSQRKKNSGIGINLSISNVLG